MISPSERKKLGSFAERRMTKDLEVFQSFLAFGAGPLFTVFPYSFDVCII